MTVLERLIGIPNLKIDKRVMEMSSAQTEMYTQALNAFIEGIPAWESELRSAMLDSDIGAISKCLIIIRGMLSDIFEEEISADCLKHNNTIMGMGKDKLEAYLINLISSVDTLSIDIQMALFVDPKSEEDSRSNRIGLNHDGGAKSILAVDDKAFFLDTLKKCIQGTQYKLTCVTSGKAALNFLQKHMPGLFILDIEMPEMDGFELAKTIRSQGHMAPIIFLTANSTKEYVMKAITAGAADFIVKPINKNQTVERIRKLI